MSSITIHLPELGEGIKEGQVIAVFVQPGDKVEKEQALIEIETDKASIEVPSPQAGTVVELLLEKGQTIAIGAPLLRLGPKAEQQAAQPEAPRATAPQAEIAQAEAPQDDAEGCAAVASAPPVSASEYRDELPVFAAPSVRSFARDLGIDVREVQGTGPAGRISVEDVKRHLRERLQETGMPAIRRAETSVSSAEPGSGSEQELSKIRKLTAKAMAQSWTTIPHVTLNRGADVTDIERLRLQYASVAEKAGGKLSLTALLVKVLASALRAFPAFNAVLDLPRERLVLKDQVNVGVAVDTPRGLLVPVVKNADTLSMVEIAVRLSTLAQHARDGKSTPDELAGATFSLTNLGGLGVAHFTPIVNPPQIGILGVGRAQLEPRWLEGRFEARSILPLSLSFDHRAADGADAARFLHRICEALESPFVLALGG
ncbi:MAG: 2-oxo acid dehydrogenase subunit E2 [Myxococcota bacterium]|jgi:pyruvate dehydrogenase E2 component (dihydrolipoamide acetyltransferase)|nr:2-oxo acid dehydrogenase subunit E2 [Myxococcota bacterium]